MQIGLPCSPSVRLETSLTDILKLEVFKGHQNGTTTYYAVNILEKSKDEMINKTLGANDLIIETVTGAELVLNKENIVTKTPVIMLKDIVDITGHSNYSERQCNSNIMTAMYEVPTRDLEFVDMYRGIDTDMGIKRLHRSNEVTWQLIIPYIILFLNH